MPFLFADLDWTNAATAVAGALVTLGAAAVGWYLLIRDKKAKLAEQDRNLTAKERAAARKERLEDERNARDEYRELYLEVKEELHKTRVVHYRCERRLARVEAALLAAKIPLPPEPPDDEDESPDADNGGVA